MKPLDSGVPMGDGDSGFARGSQLYHRHLNDPTPPTEFELLGRSWTLLSGVFAPVYTPVTKLFTTWLPFRKGGSLRPARTATTSRSRGPCEPV
jgi:hypothetical protein